jgi:DNA polymerase-3 subunit gamma/tau
VPEQELLGLAAALAAADPVALLKNIRGLLDRGREATAVLQGIAGLLRDLVLAIAAPDQPELSSFSPANRAELPALANQLGRQKLLNWQQGLRGSETQLRQSAQPRLWLEVLLLGLLSEPVIASAPAVAKPIHTPIETAVSAAVKSETPQKAPIANNEIINNNAQDLTVIWQQILASLELPSTRMLLSQQGELVRLDRSKAVVRVAPNWVAMVQSRLPLLEQATTKALGETRQVVIETGSAQVLDAQISKEITKPAISIATPKPISTPAAPIAIQKTEAISETTKSNGIEVEAKRLAEFFNGEVVLAADDLE